MNKAVFLDRDGTLGGDGFYCHPDDFRLYSNTAEAIKLLNENEIKAIVITNQTHIAYGEITLDQVNHSFHRIQKELSEAGAFLDGWYVCPHGPKQNCLCRKPKPFLFQQAAQDFDIDLTSSYMIGDSGKADMLGAIAAGCQPILVLTGLGKGSYNEFRHEWKEVEPTYIAADVLDAVKYILKMNE